MPLKLLPLQEQDIPAFSALDAAAMASSGLARAMSLSAPPDAPPRQQMIEEGTRKSFAKRGEEDMHFLKVVDTDLPAKHGAIDEGEIVSAGFWKFKEGNKEVGNSSESGGQQQMKNEGPAGTGVGVEMRKQWEAFKKDYFPNQPYADLTILVTHPDHQRRGAASMLVKWGTDQADKRGIVSVLKASQMGLGCYLKHGFEVAKEIDMDLKPFGVDEIEIRRGMIRQPKTLKSR